MILKRDRLEKAVMNCMTCDQPTIQKYAGETGPPWKQTYHYRCGCGTLNPSRIRLESIKNQESIFQKIYKLIGRLYYNGGDERRAPS